jgi:hypothetical protein
MRLEDLAPAGIAFVVVAITISIGADVLTDIGSTQTDGSIASDATLNGTEGLGELASWLPTIALVVAASVVIGVVVAYFTFKGEMD